MHGDTDMLQRVTGFTLTQGIDHPLGIFQQFAGRAYLFLNGLDNIGTCICKTTQKSLILNDVGIPHRIGSGGGDLHQLQDIIPGIVVMYTGLDHFLQHRDRVNGLGEIEHGIDGGIDLLILLQVEIHRL